MSGECSGSSWLAGRSSTMSTLIWWSREAAAGRWTEVTRSTGWTTAWSVIRSGGPGTALAIIVLSLVEVNQAILAW